MSAHPLAEIKTFPSLVKYLRDELEWPIESDDFEELTFDFQAEELGIDPKNAAKIRDIKQLRPLTSSQPWGIFFINFEPKRLPVVALRKMLGSLVVKRRATAKSAERAAWNLHDLLFISAFGEGDERQMTLAHFHESAAADKIPTLKVLGWDGLDTHLKLQHVDRELHDKLRWPEEKEPLDRWRSRWSSAFTLRHKHVIRTAQELAVQLAELAKAIRERARQVLKVENDRGALSKLAAAFREGLIHDLDDDDFADMYAQTITYGLFSAAVSRTTPDQGTTVSADNLADMVPITNPFLKEMLETFLKAGGRKGKLDFDELGIQEVVEVLNADETDINAVLRDFGNRGQGEDPVIHFYEDFLKQYNKQLKVQRGVFYTPQPVVSYIVRSVHELLQSEFGLADGLADTTTWGEMLKKHPELKLPPLTDGPGETRSISPEEPFVQILDPATGTATFLVEVIDVINKTMKAKWKKEGRLPLEIPKLWNDYVPKHLLPRLYGYELMMAPYAIAHMKIGLKLYETGYRFGSDERARIYLTNALEPWVKQLPLIGFEALAHEAAGVNEIKRQKRFTIVIGNPPYSNFGQLNKIPFILGLLGDYKRGLGEKKINLDDDFIKFVRFSQHTLDGTGAGVCGMITNNVFIDGITHRRMRESLMTSFADIRIVDLHGSSKKLEASPDGAKEENVFDIQQGVGISLLTKKPLRHPISVRHTEIWGPRESKCQTLQEYSVNKQGWTTLLCEPPNHFFVPKQFGGIEEYERQLGIAGDVFVERNAGIQTKRDGLVYSFTKNELESVLSDMRTLSNTALTAKYELPEDGRDWTVAWAKKDVQKGDGEVIRVAYHPFDLRWTWFTGRTKGFMAYPRSPLMLSALQPNLLLLTVRNPRRGNVDSFFVGNSAVDKDSVSPFDNVTFFPLYIYPNAQNSQKTLEAGSRRPNFAASFVTKLAELLGLRVGGEHGLPLGTTPEEIFHYIYAVLFSPGYRSRYAEFLKIDFPRLPLTGNLELFRALARLGGELVALHLLETPRVELPRTEFVGGRAPTVEKISWAKNTVWIDKAQSVGFKGVPENVWNFHIGGYQVCQKWLKDRKGRTLTKDDIAHYHKIVVALSETIRLMAEIDKTIDQHGGWPEAFAGAPLAKEA